MAARYGSKTRVETIGDFLTAIEKGTSLQSIQMYAGTISMLAQEEEKERKEQGAIGVGLMVSTSDLFPQQKEERLDSPWKK